MNSNVASPNGFDPKRLTRAQRIELLALLEEKERRQRERAERERVEADRRRREALETAGLMQFVPLVSPQFIEPLHLTPLVDLFERVHRGERVRACISIPTQHGKTEGLLHGVAYLLKHHPSWPFIYSTYQQEQSDDKSHRARAIARDAGVDLAPDRQNLHMWRTAKGGGCVFTSVGGPGSGQPAALGILDDPYKGRKEARSEAVRRDVENHFSSVLLQRGQEGMSIFVVHTRWEDPDLIGRIEAGAFGEGWEIVNLPMLSEQNAAGVWVPSPRPYTTATRVLNPSTKTADGRVFGWTLDGAREQLLLLPEHDAESMGQGRPRQSKDGALWTWDTITPWRLTTEPPRSKCEVYVDPNASDEAHAAKADDAGIVTIARGVDGRAYVLDDASGHVGTTGWPARAVGSYRTHKAHAIVIESDGGGDLNKKAIEAWLYAEALEKSRATGRHVEPERILIRLVRVGGRGDKRGRAETARHLYGDPLTGRPSVVSHVGHHARLEQSMTSHDFATSKRSPGDLDALSLGLAEMMLSTVQAPVYTDRPRPHMKTRL